MEISYLGHSSFKIKTKTATVVSDPFDSSHVGLKYPKVEADIITVSHDHADHNHTSVVEGHKKIISGPGEYEISGVSITGYSTYHDDKKGEERGKNTIYVYEAEGLRLVHLGDLGHDIPNEIIEEIGAVDVLMIPVGGEYTIGPKEAVDISAKIDPYFIIPMHYKVAGMKEDIFGKLSTVEEFLKEVGMQAETLPKFILKKEDIIEDQNSKVIVLEAK